MVIHGLYRFRNASGDLLYIGISRCPIDRIDEHVWKRGHSIREVAAIEVQWFDTRSEAREFEVAAIKAEQPLWNMAHRAKREAA